MRPAQKIISCAASVALVAATTLPTTALAFATEPATQSEYAALSLEASPLAEASTAFTFSDTAVTAEGETQGYTVEGTAVTITAAGTYAFSGSCSNGSITVSKNAGEVTLVLNGLDLTATDEGTCPINLKGGSNVISLYVTGNTTNTVSDANHSGAKPKSCINASGNLTIGGKGTLTVNGNNKNGIKTDTSLTIQDGVNLTVNSVDNGIAADENLTVNNGIITVTAGGDALRSNPDELDPEGSNGNVIINGGTFNLKATADGIQADSSLTIAGGTFEIETNGGSDTQLAADADSCKAIKAVIVTITDGTFDLDSADDAIDSEGTLYITGGTFRVYSGGNCLDTNANIAIAGGAFTLFGPQTGSTESGTSTKSALDWATTCVITNATLFAAGDATLAKDLSDGSQNSIVVKESVAKGKTVTFTSAAGTQVGSYEATENVNHIIFTSPLLGEGAGTYAISGGTTPVDPDTPEDYFADVTDENAWYYAPIYRSVKLGLFSGYGNSNLFGVSDCLTRGQAAVVLWRLFDPEEANTTDYTKSVSTTFSDVESGQYYTAAVEWAYSNEVVHGYDNGTFGPMDNITREQMCAIVANAAVKFRQATVEGSVYEGTNITDFDTVSDWAKESVAWCLNVGVLSGNSNGDGTSSVAPQDQLLRAMMATIMVRAVDGGIF